MSQPPYPQNPGNIPPYDPSAALEYQSQFPPAKPGSVTVLAVLAIVFGGLGSLCSGFGVVTNLIQMAGNSMISGPAGNLKLSPALQAFGVVNAVVQLGLYVTLLAVGIGALSLKPWARRTATSWWSIFMIIWAILQLLVQVVWVFPATSGIVKQMQQSNPALAGNPQMQSIMSISMIGGAIVTLLFQLLMPLLFLGLWRSPAVVGAFEPTAPGGFGVEQPHGAP